MVCSQETRFRSCILMIHLVNRNGYGVTLPLPQPLKVPLRIAWIGVRLVVNSQHCSLRADCGGLGKIVGLGQLCRLSPWVTDWVILV